MCPAAHAVKADCDGERVVLGAFFGDVAANDGGGEGAVGVVEGFEVGEAGKAGPRGGVGGDAQVHALQGALKEEGEKREKKGT